MHIPSIEAGERVVATIVLLTDDYIDVHIIYECTLNKHQVRCPSIVCR